jgi:DNA polymerase-3 subunit gamma/tau
MAAFVVSARKYRPVRFEDVVGQEAVTTTLRNAVRSGQLAHSFLFCGPRGVGKTTCARILAQAINCENPKDGVEPCGECQPCRSFRENSSFNVYEIDAASNNSVEDIRTLTEQVRFPPQAGRYKVYIIDEVHMLSTSAFNAFLKTLEEPPPYAIFIMATTEKHKILPTILSRCQIFDFSRISVADMAAHLKGIADAEQVDYEDEGLRVIAQKADGGLRDALSMFDRILAFSGGKLSLAEVLENLNILDYSVYFKLAEDLLMEDLATVLGTFQRVLEKGFEGDVFLGGLAEHLRNLLVARDPAMHALLDADGELRQRYLEQARQMPPSFVVSALAVLNEAEVQYKNSRNKRLHVEMALVKLCYLQRQIRIPSAPGMPVSGVTSAGPSSPAGEKKKQAPLAEAPPAKAEPAAAEPVQPKPVASAPVPSEPAALASGLAEASSAKEAAPAAPQQAAVSADQAPSETHVGAPNEAPSQNESAVEAAKPEVEPESEPISKSNSVAEPKAKAKSEPEQRSEPASEPKSQPVQASSERRRWDSHPQTGRSGGGIGGRASGR